ncbi:MAG: hypothetical protein AAGE52_40000 [Myxococcota bacterium]
MPAPTDELKPTTIPISWKREDAEGGWLLRASAPQGISLLSDGCAFGSQVVMSANAYGADGGYECVYLRFDDKGEVAPALHENCGLLPTLFAGPEGAPWAKVVDPYGARDVGLVLPLFGRTEVPAPKSMSAKPLEPIGEMHFLVESPHRYKKPPAGRAATPDSVVPLTVKKGIAKRGKALKLPLPIGHRAYASEEGVHSVIYERGQWVHHTFERGGDSTSRPLAISGTMKEWGGWLLPAHLSRQSESTLIHADATTLSLVRVGVDGSVVQTPLRTFQPRGDDPNGIYNVWKPVAMGNGFGFKANGDGWNGWFWVEENELKAAWVSDGGPYRDEVSGRELDLGAGLHRGGFRLWALFGTPAGAQVVFQPVVERGAKATEFLVRGLAT